MGGLSNDLISQFVKITKPSKETKKETFLYGTVVKEGGYTYVRLDGSNLLTRVDATADTVDGERVVVMIKNHIATITGNISSPAARVGDFDSVKTIANEAKQTAAKADETIRLLFDLVYPIGSFYISANNTNPKDLFGGEWEQIKDRFLLAAGDTYSGGTMGGSAGHALLTDEIPTGTGVAASSEDGINVLTPTTDICQPHSNMPPYLAVFIWKRIK